MAELYRDFIDDKANDIITKLGGTITPAPANTELYRDFLDRKFEDVINSLSTLHNSIVRGKNLGSNVTPEQYEAINNGTFDDMFLGDYWLIDNVKYRIVDFDYYYNRGNVATTKHHVVIVPDTGLVTAKYNDTATTVGGYINSTVRGGRNNSETFTGDGVNSDFTVTNTPNYTISITINGTATNAYSLSNSTYHLTNTPNVGDIIIINYIDVDYLNRGGLADCKTIIDTAFGSAHILTHKALLNNRVNNDGFEDNSIWVDSSIELMDERNLFGEFTRFNNRQTVSLISNQSLDNMQYSLFRLDIKLINIERVNYWTRNIAYTNSIKWISAYGNLAYYWANTANIKIRPAFCICK